MCKILSVWILIMGVANMASGSETTKLKELIDLGVAYHHKAVEGDKKAVKEAEKLFKNALQIEPENPVILAWYGSVLTMKGRDAWSPISKLRYVDQGIKKMDEAVKNTPDDITIRMIRASNSLALPGFLGRVDFAISDCEYLLKLREKSPESFPDEILPQIYHNLGMAYQKKGEKEKAREALEKATELSPESDTEY